MTPISTHPIERVQPLNLTTATVGLATQPLLILVGVTGTGKSTTLEAIEKSGLTFELLPDRRTLTSQFIIPTVAQWDGQIEQTFCRIERLKCTRRYRERFPGGMAHVLTQLRVVPQPVSMFVFDGLRGENEVRYAAKAFPKARFIVLEASDRDRLQRLLHRQDTFDRTAQSKATVAPVESNLDNFAALGLPEASHLFNAVEEQEILDLARNGQCSVAELHDKLKIVVAERRNYDPDATRAALEAIAPERTLAIDTTVHAPQNIAKKILSRCRVS
ncbi:MAG: AAA family ATPase [Cyanobacteriota bacterium]|nr:AAA family ATPase [Cyanobacteriota bacterium]